MQAQLRGIPLLESRPKQYMRNMTAKEACKTQKVYFRFVLEYIQSDLVSLCYYAFSLCLFFMAY